MINNLNFDKDEYFGLGCTAFIIRLEATAVPKDYILFDASGINEEIVAKSGVVRPDKLESLGSTIDLDVLALTTQGYPIKIKRILYKIARGGVSQFNKKGLDFTRASIDGSVQRGGDIQPNFLKRNWMYTNDYMVEIVGDLTIDGNTAFIIGLEKDTIIELTFIL